MPGAPWNWYDRDSRFHSFYSGFGIYFTQFFGLDAELDTQISLEDLAWPGL